MVMYACVWVKMYFFKTWMHERTYVYSYVHQYTCVVYVSIRAHICAYAFWKLWVYAFLKRMHWHDICTIFLENRMQKFLKNMMMVFKKCFWKECMHIFGKGIFFFFFWLKMSIYTFVYTYIYQYTSACVYICVCIYGYIYIFLGKKKWFLLKVWHMDFVKFTPFWGFWKHRLWTISLYKNKVLCHLFIIFENHGERWMHDGPCRVVNPKGMARVLLCEWTLVHILRVDGMKQVKIKMILWKMNAPATKNKHTFPLTRFEKQSYMVIPP